ncbi:MAG: M28 family peptidase [Crocinitomicaceae bacterium]|nr:M28 family peptidase [Crocinitomicaceae bacterium]
MRILAFGLTFLLCACASAPSENKQNDTPEISSSENDDFLSLEISSDTLIIKEHLTLLTKTDLPRNHENIRQLDSTAAYIYRHFSEFADTTYYQIFHVGEKVYRNVICSFGTDHNQQVIVGAHYDVCGNQEGADDNASGIVGLLELARLLDNQPLSKQVDLVAYTLEEPPYFRTDAMGSYVHAESLKNSNADVAGMVCLEMIGYYSDASNSQEYPDPRMADVYGTSGDFISIINRDKPDNFNDQFYTNFVDAKRIKTERISAPESVAGVDFSDHLNYWKFGYSALMITDTAFYRNHNYHNNSDTMETLDLKRMSRVIESVCYALLQM